LYRLWRYSPHQSQNGEAARAGCEAVEQIRDIRRDAEYFMSRDPEEERFARQDSGRYSGWAFAFTIAVIVLCIAFLVYYLR
jgi:hypothetical protein